MDPFTIILWIATITFFLVSIKKDKNKTINSMKAAKSMMENMAGEILAILLLIGLILTFLPPETINKLMGEENILRSTVASALVGTITLIPAFVAFPLVGSFVKNGANLIPAAAFLTTLTMVGFVTFPLEKREFGVKFALVRNLFSFFAALLIALTIGVMV